MAKEEEYVEVDAVIRMPKGERLADSKKTEGWSRGFTPKSTNKGPEHVEIRLKDQDQDEGSTSGRGPAEPQYIFIDEGREPQREKTREQQEFEEMVGLLLWLGLVKAAEWTQPRLQRMWNERVIPFFNAKLDQLSAKRDQLQERKAQRRADKQSATKAPTTVVQTVPAEKTNGVSDALRAYEANMTSAEARQHFAEALVAQHFAREKMRLLTNARIEDGGVPPELVTAVRVLTPKQVETALDSILASKPTLLSDLEQFLQMNRTEGQLQLGSDSMKAALHFTEDRFADKT